MITGMSVVAGSACSPASSPKPSRLGIITSVTTSSGGFARASSKATAPSGAVWTRYWFASSDEM